MFHTFYGCPRGQLGATNPLSIRVLKVKFTDFLALTPPGSDY